MLTRVLIVGIGGFIGANLRYGLALWLADPARDFPWPTLAANLMGCFGLAFFAALSQTQGGFSTETRLLVGTGFFGALTTFSTFNLEALTLWEAGRGGLALAYVTLSLGLGIVLGGLGLWLGRAL